MDGDVSQEAPESQEPPGQAGPPLPKLVSFWDIHKANYARAGIRLDAFGEHLRYLFKLTIVPKPAALEKCYCNVCDDAYERLFVPQFETYKSRNREHQLHMQALSGLAVQVHKRSQAPMLLIVLHRSFEKEHSGLLMVPYENLYDYNDDKVMDRHKCKLLPDSEMDKGGLTFQLFQFTSRKPPRVLGNLARAVQEVQERRQKRLRLQRAKAKAEQAEENDESGLAEEVADLLNSGGGARAAGGSGAAGSAGGAGVPRARRAAQDGAQPVAGEPMSEEDKKGFVSFLTVTFTPELLAQSLTIPERRMLIDAFNAATKTERNSKSELASLETSVDIWGQIFKEAQLSRRRAAAQAAQAGMPPPKRSLAIKALQCTPELGNNFCINNVFEAYLNRYFNVTITDAPAADPAPSAPTERGGGLRHRKAVLSMTSEQRQPAPATYIRMSFMDGVVSGNLVLVIIRHSVTGRLWEPLFKKETEGPADHVRFGILIHEDLLPKIPDHIRDALLIEPLGPDNLNHSYMNLQGVEDTLELSVGDMRELCQAGLTDLYNMADQHLRESLKVGGRPVHDIAEEHFVDVINEGIDFYNQKCDEWAAQQERLEERIKRRQELEKAGAAPGRRVVVPQSYVHNGPVLGQKMGRADRVRFVIVPLLLALTCSNNLDFLHGPACACCTGHERIHNPLVDPFFLKYVLDSTRENARLLGLVIPRRMIEWTCCWPMCEYVKRHRI
jgi:hypothetical protein